MGQSSLPIANAILLALLVLFARPIHAFVDPPVLATASPVAGQPVSINITAGVCDLLIADPPPVTTRSGYDIHMVIQSATSLDLEFCTYPTTVANIVVGTFAPGTYQLRVDRVYPGGDGIITTFVGSLSFTVGAAAGVPGLSILGLLLLASALILAAWVLSSRRATVA